MDSEISSQRVANMKNGQTLFYKGKKRKIAISQISIDEMNDILSGFTRTIFSNDAQFFPLPFVVVPMGEYSPSMYFPPFNNE